jgi:molybdate-binding protein
MGGEWRFYLEEVLAWSGGATPARSPAAVGEAASPSPTPSTSLPPLLAANGDLAVEFLLRRMAEGGSSLGLVAADRGTGLQRLRRGDVLAAGCHGPEIPATLEDQRLVFVHLVERKVGLGLRAGLKMKSLRQLRGLRIASRPETAGVRAHFDNELMKQGIDPRALHQDAAVLSSHCEVVCAVARGDADVGLTSEAWAFRVGLTFRPLCEESYGLLVRASALGDPLVVRLCELLQSGAFRRDLDKVPGYTARRAGIISYEPPRRHHSVAAT